MRTTAEPRAHRDTSLDGLRGIAALVVVVHHCLLVDPSLALSYVEHGWHGEALPEVLTHSPLHLFWAGGEAVLVFFVLSGFVLAVPAASGRADGWRAYYPRRFARLYLPVMAAVALALPQTRYLRSDTAGSSSSWWVNAHTGTGGVHVALHDALLIRGTGFLDSALWSLRWEVIFSLALPAYLWLLRIRSCPMTVVAVAVSLGLVTAAPYTGHDSMRYLPIFALGVLICSHRAAIRRLAESHSTPMLLLGLLALATPWTLAVVYAPTNFISSVLAAGTAAGAALIVCAFLGGAIAQLSRSRPSIQWLGRRSFSLYLVHEPLVVTVTHLLGDSHSAWLVLVLALPLSLLGAEWFGRVIEEPSHRLAQRVGRKAARV